MKHQRINRWIAGFTLIELMIATAITAISLIIMFAFLGDLQRLFVKASAKQSAQEQMDEIVWQFKKDIRTSYGAVVGNAWLPFQCYPYFATVWKNLTPGDWNFVGTAANCTSKTYKAALPWSTPNNGIINQRSIKLIVSSNTIPPTAITWTTECEANTVKGFQTSDRFGANACLGTVTAADPEICPAGFRPVLRRTGADLSVKEWPRGLTSTPEKGRPKNALSMALCADVVYTEEPFFDVAIISSYWDRKRNAVGIGSNYVFHIKNFAGGQIQ